MNKCKIFELRSTVGMTILIGMTLASCHSSDPDPAMPSGSISTIAGIAGEFNYSGDGGPAVSANLGYITGITVDGSGNIYFVDGAANVVRKIDRSTGNISTIAGTFIGFNVADPNPAHGDGGPATSAHFNVPFGVSVDAAGNVFIADAGNNILRKVNFTDGEINTFAGKAANMGFSGDGGLATAAQLAVPYDVVAASSGVIYFVDSQNHVIQQIETATGILTTVAGKGPLNPGYEGDGGSALAARLKAPQGIAVDSHGNIYIADTGNNVIRKVTLATGLISTLAGSGTLGYSGDGGPAIAAKLYSPTGVAVDAAGDVYVADHGNHVIRKITLATGIIRTLAGTGVEGYGGDGGPATAAQLSSPQGVAVDASGNVFVTDVGNSVIRAIKQ